MNSKIFALIVALLSAETALAAGDGIPPRFANLFPGMPMNVTLRHGIRTTLEADTRKSVVFDVVDGPFKDCVLLGNGRPELSTRYLISLNTLSCQADQVLVSGYIVGPDQVNGIPGKTVTQKLGNADIYLFEVASKDPMTATILQKFPVPK